jgi:hypothetical protein
LEAETERRGGRETLERSSAVRALMASAISLPLFLFP